MNNHTVNRQIIDLTVSSQQNAFRLQQQARETWENDLLPVFGELLDEIAGPDEFIRIEKLELDIGTIPSERLSREMKERVREKMREQLLKCKTEAAELKPVPTVSRLKPAEQFPAGIRRISKKGSVHELLEFFFINGTLPWWVAEEKENPDIDTMLEELLVREPLSTLQFLQEIAAKHRPALRRIVLQTGNKIQQRLLAVVSETVRRQLTHWSETFTRLLSLSGWTVPDRAETRQAVLAAALLSSTNGGKTVIPQEEFLIRFLQQLAAETQTPLLLFHRRLYEGLVIHAAKAKKAELKKDEVLIRHFISWEKAEPEIASNICGSTGLTLEALIGEKEKGSIREQADRIEKMLEEFFAVVQFRRKLRKEKQRSVGKKQVLRREEESAAELQEHAAEEAEETALAQAPSKKKRSREKQKPGKNKQAFAETEAPLSSKKRQALPEPEPPHRSTKKLEEETAGISKPKKGKAGEATENAIRKTTKKTEESNLVFSDPLQKELAEPEEKKSLAEITDEEEFSPLKKPAAGMTRFAGLALFGPFLQGLFSALNYVQDGKFISEKEQVRAVFFLHYLATGKTKAPEFRLSLHKLLCGLKLTDTVPGKITLTAEEKKEAKLFLDDVAEQWTALQGASGEALQHTFMKRNGIIEKKENAWLLRIERGPMDIMIDTLPWSLSLIKLPWMQQLLYVEW